MEVLEERLVTKYDAMKILHERIKNKTATSLQNSTYEILKEVAKTNPEKIDELRKRLEELRLRERDIIMILDFLPKDKDELRLIFEKEYSKFDEETISKILEITNSV